MMDTGENYLTPDEERSLLAAARAALEAHLNDRPAPDTAPFRSSPTLLERHGAFVTLRRGGELRGCIGYTANEMPLLKTVEENAINAATRDYRFPSVTAAELGDITIEISALTPGDSPDTPFKIVNDLREIVIGRDGLYIERPPMRGGILLPQVAVEQGWDVPTFLSAVCRKAGYPDRAWEQPGYNLYRFSAQVFSEEER
jgi:AmmeMemoRadiSam system protein A